MAEYTDREAMLKRIKDDFVPLSLAMVFNHIHNAPAADVAPVVHGRWTETDWVEMESGGHELIKTPKAALRCSNCRNCFKKELLWKNNFCHNCGAKMDKKEATYD